MAKKVEELQRQDIRDKIARRLASVPEVRKVCADQEGNVFHVRVAVADDRDREVRRKVYTKELEIVGEFETFEFEFAIVTDADGLEDFVTSTPEPE